MNESDYTALISALNSALEILERNRTPTPEFVAAHDTLKQSRAMIAKAFGRAPAPVAAENASLAA